MASNFADRIYHAVKNKATPLTVGLDPMYSHLPSPIRDHHSMNDAADVGAVVDAIFDFCTQVIRLVAPMVPAVKINIAFFERYFWEGIEAYYALISEADHLDLEVIGDVKRGDVGHTAEYYAHAYLENPELLGLEDVLTPDAITVNGFAGAEGIEPFVSVASQQGKGVFVWVHSSNEGAAAIQDFCDAQGQAAYEKIAHIVGEIAGRPECIGKSGYSCVGMVVGGISPEVAASLRRRYDKTWFLVPGYGSQGASAVDCVRFCKPDGTGALINASRSIIYAYENPKYKEQIGDNWKKCIEQAVIDAKVDLSKALTEQVL